MVEIQEKYKNLPYRVGVGIIVLNKENKITPINPTPVIGMVGKIENVERAISSKWKNINDHIWLIGSYKSETTIAASSYLEYFHGEITGRPPQIDLQDEKFCQSFLRYEI